MEPHNHELALESDRVMGEPGKTRFQTCFPVQVVDGHVQLFSISS